MIKSDQFYRPDAPELRVIAEIQTLAKWRHEGRGPRYMKTGSRVIYSGSDVLAWLNSNIVETAA